MAKQPIILGTCGSPSSASQVLQQRPVSGCSLYLNSSDFALLGHSFTKKFVLNVLLSFKTWRWSLTAQATSQISEVGEDDLEL